MAGQPPFKGRYSYNAARAYCRSIGIPFHEAWAAIADAHFAAAELSQPQVDAVLELHAWHVNHLFTPSNYQWHGRLAVALFFLFGRKRKV